MRLRAAYSSMASSEEEDAGGRRKGEGAREGVPEWMLSVRRPPRKGLVLGVTYWLGSAPGCSDAAYACAGDSAGCAESESDAEMMDGDSDVEYTEQNGGDQGKGKGKEGEKKGKGKAKDVGISSMFGPKGGRD